MKKPINTISFNKFLALSLMFAVFIQATPLRMTANAVSIDVCSSVNSIEDLKVLTATDVQITDEDTTVFGKSFKSEFDKVFVDGKITDTSCIILDPMFNNYNKEFTEFIDTTFKNKSSTTSLSNIAIAEYYNYKKRLRETCGLFNNYIVGGRKIEDKESYTIIQSCRNLISDYETKASDTMKNHMKENVVQKRATILLEKLKAINGQMSELTMKIGQVYSYIRTFCGKLQLKTNSPVTGR